jgi:crotonobetainyl-CoA:carnitine CoA-transferase CaiB-like acyl-CoA transferase
MSTPVEIATAAASAVVGTMATQAWARISELCSALFQRYLDGEARTAALTRLDTHHQALSALDAQAREALSKGFAADTAQDLTKVLERSPEAAEQVRSLTEQARSAAAPEASVVSDVRVEDVRAKGDVIVGGGNVTVGRNR